MSKWYIIWKIEDLFWLNCVEFSRVFLISCSVYAFISWIIILLVSTFLKVFQIKLFEFNFFHMWLSCSQNAFKIIICLVPSKKEGFSTLILIKFNFIDDMIKSVISAFLSLINGMFFQLGSGKCRKPTSLFDHYIGRHQLELGDRFKGSGVIKIWRLSFFHIFVNKNES